MRLFVALHWVFPFLAVTYCNEFVTRIWIAPCKLFIAKLYLPCERWMWRKYACAIIPISRHSCKLAFSYPWWPIDFKIQWGFLRHALLLISNQARKLQIRVVTIYLWDLFLNKKASWSLWQNSAPLAKVLTISFLEFNEDKERRPTTTGGCE